jgi:hypothetical protein
LLEIKCSAKYKDKSPNEVCLFWELLSSVLRWEQ